MKRQWRKIWLGCMGFALFEVSVQAQTGDWVSSCEGKTWTQNKVKLQTKAEGTTADLSVDKGDSVVVFKAWGTCFNELGWDALNVLPSNEKEDILRRLFSPEGDLRFTLGRFPMNANDFSRNWYSCDEVPGDFELKHFNIDRDKTSLVPYIKSAQHYNPNMTFWISPWSPPSWMKINQDYPVRSDKYNTMHPAKDYYLQGNKGPKTEGVFPAELAETDFFIQDPRYLSAYANFFCKFVSAYKELNIPIKMVMFQNESWSYTPYPGCAWTPEGIIRFNVEYLAPALKKAHPDVKLYFGTINTNRYEVIEKVLDDPVFEREADDPDRNHRQQEFQHVGLLLVEPPREEPPQQARHLAPQHDDRAEYRSGVQYHVEEQVLFDLYPHERLGDLQVPAARHGQELGKPLHDAQDNGLYRIHLLPAFEDGVNFECETADDQNRRQRDAPPRKHGVVELVGRVAAAARHEDHPQQNDRRPDEQQHVIFRRERHLGVVGIADFIEFFHCVSSLCFSFYFPNRRKTVPAPRNSR